MAFKAKTLNARPSDPNAYERLAPPRDVGGLTVPSRLTAFPGKPSKALLEDDCIDVQTITGDPWPRSSCDRNSKLPNKMRFLEDEGLWPTEREKAMQEFAEHQLADPEHVARHMLKEQGESDAAVEKRIGRMKWKGADIPTIPPKKRGPGRPPKKTGTED